MIDYEPDAEDIAKIIANDRGGKQSQIKGKMTEVPPLALLELSKVMEQGSETYPREPDGTPNWYKIGCYSNLDHGLEHAINFLIEHNKPEPDQAYMLEELSHLAARSMMALEQFIRRDL